MCLFGVGSLTKDMFSSGWQARIQGDVLLPAPLRLGTGGGFEGGSDLFARIFIKTNECRVLLTIHMLICLVK